MADHVVRGGARVGRAVLGVLAGLAVCGGVIALAVASFGLNPVTPVFVSFGAIAGGAYLVRRTHDPILRGLAIGLLAGGIVAVLLWPLFDVNADGGVELRPRG
jgi:peptidoglycan biosynthesis protein MviN/MurJ (putative lipid II flippase)